MRLMCNLENKIRVEGRNSWFIKWLKRCSSWKFRVHAAPSLWYALLLLHYRLSEKSEHGISNFLTNESFGATKHSWAIKICSVTIPITTFRVNGIKPLQTLFSLAVSNIISLIPVTISISFAVLIMTNRPNNQRDGTHSS